MGVVTALESVDHAVESDLASAGQHDDGNYKRYATDGNPQELHHWLSPFFLPSVSF